MAEDGQTRIVPNQSVAPGTRLNGVFEIESKIASGGMGEVFRGHNIATSEPVAIKIVLPEFSRDDMIRELFFKEARVLSSLNHPVIVRYQMFTVEPVLGRPYLVMEYIDGCSLDEMIQTSKMSVPEVKLLVAKVADALEAAHQAGVVHRDLSPDNILLANRNVAQPRIIDFGIARTLQSGTATILGNRFAGRENYASPEQYGLFGGNVGAASDIYSLGLVIVAMLRGRPLDMGGTQYEQLEKRGRIPDLDGVDESVRAALEMMLAPNPADRRLTMADIAGYFSGRAPLPVAEKPPEPETAPAREDVAGSPPPTETTLERKTEPDALRESDDEDASEDVWVLPTDRTNSAEANLGDDSIFGPEQSATEHSAADGAVDARTEQASTDSRDTATRSPALVPSEETPQTVGAGLEPSDQAMRPDMAPSNQIDDDSRTRIAGIAAERSADMAASSAPDLSPISTERAEPPAEQVFRIGGASPETLPRLDQPMAAPNAAARPDSNHSAGGKSPPRRRSGSMIFVGGVLAVAAAAGTGLYVTGIQELAGFRLPWAPTTIAGPEKADADLLPSMKDTPVDSARDKVPSKENRITTPSTTDVKPKVTTAVADTVPDAKPQTLPADDVAAAAQSDAQDQSSERPAAEETATADQKPLVEPKQKVDPAEQASSQEVVQPDPVDTIEQTSKPADPAADAKIEELPTADNKQDTALKQKPESTVIDTPIEEAWAQKPDSADVAAETQIPAEVTPLPDTSTEKVEAATSNQTDTQTAAVDPKTEQKVDVPASSAEVPDASVSSEVEEPEAEPQKAEPQKAEPQKTDPGVVADLGLLPSMQTEKTEPAVKPVIDEETQADETEPKAEIVTPETETVTPEAIIEKLKPAKPVEQKLETTSKTETASETETAVAKPTDEIAALDTKPSAELGDELPQKALEPAEWIRNYDGGGCFFAEATQVGDKFVKVSGLSNDIQTFHTLDSSFEQAFGYAANIRGRPIDDSQCLVTKLLNTLHKKSEPQIRLKLEADKIKNGDFLRGEVDKTDGAGPVLLLLVDHDGWVYNISRRLKQRDDGSLVFGQNISEKRIKDGTFKIVLALSGEAVAPFADDLKPVKSDKLIPLLIEAASDGRVQYAYGFFKMTAAN